MKQLLIGPRKFKKGKITGGEVVLFENWISFCDEKGLEYDVVDANKNNYMNKGFALLKIYWQILTKSSKADVLFLQGSKNDYFFIAPFMALVATIFHKPFFLRKFAGEFDKDFYNATKLKRAGVKWAMKRATALFFEVKSLLPFGKKFNKNTYWFPNTRRRPNLHRDTSLPYNSKKFVFISQVRKEKGIEETLEAFRILGPEYSIDIYGPLIGYSAEQLDGHYKGVLTPSQVPDVLNQYLLLLLSSWKEGYPGIIIEAFGAGLPVVASRAGGIPEMVSDGFNGVLCEPHKAEDIVRAIKRIEKMNLRELSENALKSFDTYDNEIVNNNVLKIIKDSIFK